VSARRVVVVGASAAGTTVAESIARLDPEREVVIVGDGPDLAHDRPPLSKQVLAGDWEPDQAALLPPARRAALTARLVLGSAATGLDCDRRLVHLDDGDSLAYDDLVIATGVRPRRLDPATPPGLHVLRDLADSLRLRAELGPGRRLVVVGGGFIGLEVAATARRLGTSVVVLEPTHAPLAPRLGATAAARLVERHRREGVDVRTGIGVVAVETGTDGRVARVLTTDGAEIGCSTVLVSIGSEPTVGWLVGSGLDLTDGVVCDEFCRAAPGVWAAGDVACWHHRSLGRLVRVEHRLNATEQGLAVATNIVGPARPFTPTPFFWTDQYDVRVQLAGELSPDAVEEIEPLDGADSFLHTFRIDGVLTAALAWNAARALLPLRRELAATLSPV
jgi:NADPH-dependent 2,4-dienoyl-CoA reductase/sulfur reductase-like enzyme